MAETSITVRLVDLASQGLSDVNRSLTSIDKNAGSLTTTMNGLKNAAVGFATAVASQKTLDFVNTIQTLDNRIKVVTNSQAELNKAYNDLYDISQKTRQPLETTVTIYSRMTQASQQLGLSQADVTQLTENFNKALAIGGATTAEAQSAMIQFTQALNSGKAQMSDLNPLLDSAPVLMRALYQSLGVTAGEFRNLVKEGKITSEMLSSALLVATKDLGDQFDKTSTTVGQSITQMTNAFTKLGREFLDQTGLADDLVKAFKYVTDNMDDLVAIGKVAGIALGALAVVFAPVTAAVVAAGAAVVYFADELGPLAKSLLGVFKSALEAVIPKVVGFGAAIKALLDFKNPFDAYTEASQKSQAEFTNQSKVTKELTDTTKAQSDATTEGTDKYNAQREALQKQIAAVKEVKLESDKYIQSLRDSVKVAGEDKDAKEVQANVTKALAAYEKDVAADRTKFSQERVDQIKREVEEITKQQLAEEKVFETRKKLIDDLKKKQEEGYTEAERILSETTRINKEYDALIVASKNATAEEIVAINKKRDETLATMRDIFLTDELNKNKKQKTDLLTEEEKFKQAVEEINAKYRALDMENTTAHNESLQRIKDEYGKKYRDIAKKYQEEELTSTENYVKQIQDLEKAAADGRISDMTVFDANRRKIEKDYREAVTQEYSSLYGVLTEKIQNFTGLNQKEFGILKDTVKLVFGVDINDIIKQAFAEFIKYVIGFRTASEGEVGLFTGIFSKIFGKSGNATNEVSVFAEEGKSLMNNFVDGSGSILGGLTGILKNIFSGGLDIIGSFISSAFDLFKGFGSGVGSLLGNIFDGIGGIFSGGGGGGGGILNSIIDIGSSIFSGGGDILSSIGSTIGDIFGGSDILSTIGSSIGDIFGGGDILSSIGDFFGGGDLLGTLGGIGSFIGLVDIFSSFGSARQEKLRDQQNAAVGQYRGQISQISQAKTALTYDVGSNYALRYYPRDANGFTKTVITVRSTGEQITRNLNLSGIASEYGQLGSVDNQVIGYLASGNVKYGAKGMLLNGPIAFPLSGGMGVIGEAGPEAVLPLARDSSGNLGVRSVGSGDVNVNFTINAVDARGIDTLLVEKKELITNIVRAAVAERGVRL